MTQEGWMSQAMTYCTMEHQWPPSQGQCTLWKEWHLTQCTPSVWGPGMLLELVCWRGHCQQQLHNEIQVGGNKLCILYCKWTMWTDVEKWSEFRYGCPLKCDIMYFSISSLHTYIIQWPTWESTPLPTLPPSHGTNLLTTTECSYMEKQQTTYLSLGSFNWLMWQDRPHTL